MPTGYTAAVQDGTITTLDAFALRCARAFGACVSMRDDPTDAPIPERFEPNTAYYDEKIAEAREIVDTLPGLTAIQCDLRAFAEWQEQSKNAARYTQEGRDCEARYRAMIAAVTAWQVPESHAEFRAFMLGQLEESIRFDCGHVSRAPEASGHQGMECEGQ